MALQPYNPAEVDALNLSGRSPFSVKVMPGVPNAPQRITATDVTLVNGTPTIDGVPLAPINKTAQELVLNHPAETPAPTPIYEDGLFGDSQSFQVNLVAGQPVNVLPRPNNRRTQLTVQNQNAVGSIFYQFDKPADTVNCIAIVAGGNRLWDTVIPQGDLWLIAPANSVVVVEYINKDVQKPAG